MQMPLVVLVLTIAFHPCSCRNNVFCDNGMCVRCRESGKDVATFLKVATCPDANVVGGFYRSVGRCRKDSRCTATRAARTSLCTYGIARDANEVRKATFSRWIAEILRVGHRKTVKKVPKATQRTAKRAFGKAKFGIKSVQQSFNRELKNSKCWEELNFDQDQPYKVIGRSEPSTAWEAVQCELFDPFFDSCTALFRGSCDRMRVMLRRALQVQGQCRERMLPDRELMEEEVQSEEDKDLQPIKTPIKIPDNAPELAKNTRSSAELFSSIQLRRRYSPAKPRVGEKIPAHLRRILQYKKAKKVEFKEWAMQSNEKTKPEVDNASSSTRKPEKTVDDSVKTLPVRYYF